MPIYEYRCDNCQTTFEEWQKDFEEREAPCPGCGAGGRRIVSSTSFVLKGSGWYVTDYCKGKGSTQESAKGTAAGPSAAPS